MWGIRKKINSAHDRNNHARPGPVGIVEEDKDNDAGQFEDQYPQVPVPGGLQVAHAQPRIFGSIVWGSGGLRCNSVRFDYFPRVSR